MWCAHLLLVSSIFALILRIRPLLESLHDLLHGLTLLITPNQSALVTTPNVKNWTQWNIFLEESATELQGE